MAITRREVEHVARLARLALTDDEMELFSKQLSRILDHAARVTSLDTEGVEPTAHPIVQSNVFRPDEEEPTLDREEALSQAPDSEDGYFKVPKIL